MWCRIRGADHGSTVGLARVALAAGRQDQIEAVDQHSTCRPGCRDDDLIADRLVLLPRVEDHSTFTPRDAAVGGFGEQRRTAEGGGVDECARIGIGARRHQPIPHRVGHLGLEWVGRD